MRGLLADANLDGQTEYIRGILANLGLLIVLNELGMELATFADVQLARSIDDRELWSTCQRQGWVLFTDNRNLDGVDSLEAVLRDSWSVGHLPILTLASKLTFDRSSQYAERTATDLAELLFGIRQGEYRDRPRNYVPI